jgi:glycopeptide antibiotics resistance protein
MIQKRMLNDIKIQALFALLGWEFRDIQALFSIGSFDVDDLILNSSGGLIGFIIFKLFTKLVTAASVIQARGRSI